MKTTLLSISVLLMLSTNMIAQVAFPTNNAIWVNTEYTYTFNPPNPIPFEELNDVDNYCVSGQDTTILGNDYTKVFYCGDAYKGALREENSVVYFVPADSTDEYLLYDFSAQVGQTLEDVYVGNHFDESFILQNFTVQQIGTEVIGGLTRRVVWADNYRWIEGIGCENGLFMEPWTNVSMYAVFLECMSVNGQRLFPTEGNDACPLTVGVNSYTNEIEARVYPNPTSDVIQIQLNAAADLTVHVLDIQGRVMETRTIKNITGTEIRLGGQPGMYFINLSTENYGTKMFRIVKN